MDKQKMTLEDCDRNGPDSGQTGPKVTRLRISKPQHQAVIKLVAAQLGSDKPMDGLEHILNCWLVGNIPPVASSHPQPIEAVTDDDDDYSQIMEF